MIILQGKEISQSFGADDIFSDIDFQLEAKERVGLVGPNGIGKTTLLLIIAGLQEPRAGAVARARDLSLGYLRQEAVLTFAGQDNTIFAEMLSVFNDLRAIEAQLRVMEAQMAAGAMDQELLSQYGGLLEQFEIGGGYEYTNEIKKVLQGLGFSAEEWETPLTHLSGGQKTRVLLGRLLLEQPELLILDEPTNHLDTAAIEWLEKTLHSWNGALLIVSHDRYFLDRVVNRVWDMAADRLRSFKGDYSSYVKQRESAGEFEEALFSAEKERLQKELEFVKKNIAGGKTDIAKGKLKRLTRDIVLIEEVGVLATQGKSWLEIGGRVRTLTVNEAQKRIQELQPPHSRPPKLRIKLTAAQRSSRFVFRTKRMTIGYADAPLFTTDKLHLERLDCVALIGPNGCGKTTFLRTLRGEINPLRGKIRYGEELIPGYFAQGHEQLNLELTVLAEVLAHKAMSETDGRNYLAQYLFRGEDVFKQVGDLSGGERGRLALALLALDGANFLLLDEPTNHLDIPSQEILQTVLEQFDGTIILVSHDRYLVDRLATQIWEIREGHLHPFVGTYQEFLAAREGRTANVTTISSKVHLPASEQETAPIDLEWVADLQPAPPLLSEKEERNLIRQIHVLTAQVEETEAWLTQLEFDLQEQQITDRHRQQLEMEKQIAQEALARLNAELDPLLG